MRALCSYNVVYMYTLVKHQCFQVSFGLRAVLAFSCTQKQSVTTSESSVCGSRLGLAGKVRQLKPASTTARDRRSVKSNALCDLFRRLAVFQALADGMVDFRVLLSDIDIATTPPLANTLQN